MKTDLAREILHRMAVEEERLRDKAQEHGSARGRALHQAHLDAINEGWLALEREIAREVINLAAPGHSSTETLIAALRHLAGEIVAPDDIAATALREAADRLEALSKG